MRPYVFRGLSNHSKVPVARWKDEKSAPIERSGHASSQQGGCRSPESLRCAVLCRAVRVPLGPGPWDFPLESRQLDFDLTSGARARGGGRPSPATELSSRTRSRSVSRTAGRTGAQDRTHQSRTERQVGNWARQTRVAP
jgi:hypothetical protein